MLISDQYQLSFLDKTSAAYLKAASGSKVETLGKPLGLPFLESMSLPVQTCC
jgi:hypothetical protein